MSTPNEIVNARLRIPRKVHRVLKKLAEDNRRSLNAQICLMLTEYVRAIARDRKAQAQKESDG